MADDLIVAAIERVTRKRLTSGGTMFFAATGAPESGRERMCVILTPSTHVAFTYTDTTDVGLSPTVDVLQRHIDTHGGIELDVNDLPVEPS